MKMTPDANTDVERDALDVEVRRAAADERLPVRQLLDAAVLAVENLDERLAAGDVLVAEADGRAVGTLVLSPHGDSKGAFIEAIAVRRRRRGRGVGRTLIERAREDYGPLAAEFDADVRPFYDSLNFVVEPTDADDDRYRGVLE